MGEGRSIHTPLWAVGEAIEQPFALLLFNKNLLIVRQQDITPVRLAWYTHKPLSPFMFRQNEPRKMQICRKQFFSKVMNISECRSILYTASELIPGVDEEANGEEKRTYGPIISWWFIVSNSGRFCFLAVLLPRRRNKGWYKSQRKTTLLDSQALDSDALKKGLVVYSTHDECATTARGQKQQC